MKLIQKNKTGKGYSELLAIHKVRGSYEDTKNDVSKGIFTRTNILKDLLSEQGFLCAYCMRQINETNASIEHVVGQNYVDENGKLIGKELDTDYNNILAVCDGQLCQNDTHCDKSRSKYQIKKPLLYISPLDSTQMQYISFTRNGKIEYKIDDENIEDDLNRVLNLNCETLVENRKRVKDAVLGQLIKKNFEKKYAKKLFDYWDVDSKEYSQVAVEELRKHI
jgi:uncharacterized protein (TIGR02646 family)